MERVEDEVFHTVGACVPRHLLTANLDHHLVDIGAHQDALMRIGDGNRVVRVPIPDKRLTARHARTFIARLERNGGLRQKGSTVRSQKIKDTRAFRAAKGCALTLPAPLRQHRVQLVDVRSLRNRNHEGSAGEAHHAFARTLVVAPARSAEPVVKQIM